MKTVHIELISDFICPWCYLGKARLERVKISLAEEIKLNIEIKPYVLYPHIPKGGLPKSDFAKKTKPGMGKSLKEEAKREGIQFNYKYIEQIPNSLEAHRLVWLVSDNSLKYKIAMKIFHGYFETGKNIEEEDYLMEVGKSVGVEAAVLKQFKETNDGVEDMKSYIQTTKEAFITLVPSIKIDRKFLIPGLQTAAVWENYFRRAARIQ